MICKNCNSELPENAVFCPVCGTAALQKQNFCPKCGRKLEEDEFTCPACSPAIEELKACATENKTPLRKRWEIAAVIIWGLLFIFSKNVQSFCILVALFAIPISFVGIIVQLVRKKSIKKFALVIGVALLIMVASLVIDFVAVFIPGQNAAERLIVGEWEATVATVYDSPTFFDKGEGLILTAKKDGTARLKSHDDKIDLELYWSYDEDGTDRLREGTGDPTVCVYDLLYGDRNIGLNAFYCMAHDNDLYIQSNEEYDDGEFSAYFKPRN